MHEEDFGVGWKHTDFRTEKVEVRRSRRLVISCFATVGNYEYGFFWYLYTDGSIQYEVKLTGVLSTGAIPVGDEPRFGNLVAPGLYGPHHQHFFNVRLDMQVDGERNSVYEVDAAALPPGPDNPYGNAWVTNKTLLARESEAQRLIDPFIARAWYVVNPSQRNELGQPVGYKLMPGENVLPLQQEGSQAFARAQFAYKHLWVTAFDDGERYAAGDYPNQHGSPGGLVEYQKADRPLEDAGPRRLVLLRRPPRRPAGGLAGHAGRLRRLPPQAGRLLRREPCPGHAAVHPGLPHRQRTGRARRARAHEARATTAADARRWSGRIRRPGRTVSTEAVEPPLGGQPVQSDRGLAHDSMSQLEVMAQSVAAIAPSAVMATGPALIVLYAGEGAWLSYLAAIVVVVLIGLCVAQFGRRFASSGSLYSYVARGLGPDRRLRGRLGAGHRLHLHRDDRCRRHRPLPRQLPGDPGPARRPPPSASS